MRKSRKSLNAAPRAAGVWPGLVCLFGQFLPHRPPWAHAHADFLSPEPPAVHGGPGEGGGVGVAASVRRLELPTVEAVPTDDERVVPKTRTRQVRPGSAPGADGGQPVVRAVQAHVCRSLVEKKRAFLFSCLSFFFFGFVLFQRPPTEGRAPSSASPVAQMKVCCE